MSSRGRKAEAVVAQVRHQSVFSLTFMAPWMAKLVQRRIIGWIEQKRLLIQFKFFWNKKGIQLDLVSFFRGQRKAGGFLIKPLYLFNKLF